MLATILRGLARGRGTPTYPAAWAGPTFSAAGAGAAIGVGGGSLASAYPAGLANNDLLLISANAHTGTISTPAGWTLEADDTNLVSERHYIFSKRSNGTETGSVTLTSSTYGVTRMYAFSAVALSSYKEDHNASPNNGGPSLTSLGTNRLAVCLQAGYGSTPDSIAGATNGPWLLSSSYRDAGTTLCCSLHICELTGALTISGGASTSYGECVGQGFILKS